MISDLFFDSIFGLLLIVILSSIYASFWFLPSPFNTSLLKSLFSEEDSDSLKSFLLSLAVLLISCIFQIAIPSGFVVLKQFLTSKLLVLDVLIICTAPAICLFCVSLLRISTNHTRKRKVSFILDKTSFEKMYSSSSEGKYKEFKVESIDGKELGSELYKVSFTADPEYLQIDIMGEVLSIGGLLAICLSGGLIGYLLGGRLG